MFYKTCPVLFLTLMDKVVVGDIDDIQTPFILLNNMVSCFTGAPIEPELLHRSHLCPFHHSHHAGKMVVKAKLYV